MLIALGSGTSSFISQWRVSNIQINLRVHLHEIAEMTSWIAAAKRSPASLVPSTQLLTATFSCLGTGGCQSHHFADLYFMLAGCV